MQRTLLAEMPRFRSAVLERGISIGQASAHTLGIWDRLTLFVEDPPLDNNATKTRTARSCRGTKEPRRIEVASRTEVAATLYSILETAKLHKPEPDPAAYLAAAIAAADRGETPLPRAFSAK